MEYGMAKAAFFKVDKLYQRLPEILKSFNNFCFRIDFW